LIGVSILENDSRNGQIGAFAEALSPRMFNIFGCILDLLFLTFYVLFKYGIVSFVTVRQP